MVIGHWSLGFVGLWSFAYVYELALNSQQQSTTKSKIIINTKLFEIEESIFFVQVPSFSSIPKTMKQNQIQNITIQNRSTELVVTELVEVSKSKVCTEQQQTYPKSKIQNWLTLIKQLG
ncbi:hypothetical protein [Brunnivagina elsteri]|uniref:Uncharacterized protein n=1 Tax=Brunnivagina elsteri CCALA 953 TaxID=987040 RepID=A0A2A2TNJ5_9CYAN|nr:hypothetical protein [Calothrix elsteri]PAX60020.1 hypothetical protein CK510_03890 [Calothrix elsteri CCALA 953]